MSPDLAKNLCTLCGRVNNVSFRRFSSHFRPLDEARYIHDRRSREGVCRLAGAAGPLPAGEKEGVDQGRLGGAARAPESPLLRLDRLTRALYEI